MTPRRIGIATGACMHRPITEVLPDLKAAGAVGIEIGTPPGHFSPGDPDQVEALAELVTRLALSPISIHAPFSKAADLASPHRHERERAIAAHAQAVDALARLGGQIVVAHPSDLERHEHDAEECLEHAVRGLRIVGDYCHDLGLTLAVESPLPHLIGGHPDEFRWLLSELDPSVQVCLDTGHITLGHHWPAFVDVAGARLVHVHASDNHGTFDDHLPPGDGRIHWDEIRRSLDQLSFTGWIMLELSCPHATTGDLTRALGQTRRLLGG